MFPPPARIPRATYRMQFTPAFGFEDARKLVTYLVELGVSELYASPIFQASAQSTHGYDVNDYNRISRALGGREALDQLSEALHAAHLGLLIDFVPNHMGIDGEYNAWWRDVLENGIHSRFASTFDIEWHPRLERLHDRVLVPMLGDHYGTVLESGGLPLKYDGGRFFIHYGQLKLPLSPETYGLVLEQVVELLPSGDPRKARLRELGDGLANLSTHNPDEREKIQDTWRGQWAELVRKDESLREILRTALTKINGTPGQAASFSLLHDLLERQHYRLAYWKVGAHEVNYRRFFAVDTLVGLKMEAPEVFAATHCLLGELIAARTISGIRLDHIDGLWNPAEYLERLHDLVREKLPDGAPLYTLVEKILEPGENLPDSWATHGTTGYEFAGSLINLFLDRRDEPAWTRIYENFTGEHTDSLDLTYEDKLFALQEIFPNAVTNLAAELDALIEPDWRWRDLSLHDLATALRHLLACLPVYRTYRMPGEEMKPEEKKWMLEAQEEAIRRNPCIDPMPIRFVVRVITGDYPPADASAEQRESFSRWVCKLQQATGAVMAKSVEDTHFYRYVRMLGANEVGSHPSHFGEPVAAFHQANADRREHQPFCLLTTSTHDTKLSEDARARLLALAECPQAWETKLTAWHRLNAPLATPIGKRRAPDAREEYLLYQALLAVWPLELAVPDAELRRRLKDYFRKAQAEAKLNTTWTFPHEKWQNAGDRFIDGLLDSSDFLNDFLPFARLIFQRGMVLSLAQTVLRLTAPGVPDLYQGTELWDFSLVDPDNRRPVDFHLRRELLAGLKTRSPEELLQNWKDGAIKLKVIQSLLHSRREFPDLFSQGNYLPLSPQGEKAEDAVAFLRQHKNKKLLVVVPRRLGSSADLPVGKGWGNTSLSLSEARSWKSLLTGRDIGGQNNEVFLSDIFSDWPVAVLLAS